MTVYMLMTGHSLERHLWCGGLELWQQNPEGPEGQSQPGEGC